MVIRPQRVSPAAATSRLTGRSVSKLRIAVAMVIPALGPSSGSRCGDMDVQVLLFERAPGDPELIAMASQEGKRRAPTLS